MYFSLEPRSLVVVNRDVSFFARARRKCFKSTWASSHGVVIVVMQFDVFGTIYQGHSGSNILRVLVMCERVYVSVPLQINATPFNRNARWLATDMAPD